VAKKTPKKAPPALKKSAAGKAAGKVISAITGKGGKKGGRRKKGSGWYAREIQRVKLKRKLEKLRYGGLR